LRGGQGRAAGGAESHAHVWWQHVRALRANGRDAPAQAALTHASGLLVASTAALSDEGLRRSALHAPESHADLVLAWIELARRLRLPCKHVRAHLAGAPANLQESVERLVGTGLRLNAAGSSAVLHADLEGAFGRFTMPTATCSPPWPSKPRSRWRTCAPPKASNARWRNAPRRQRRAPPCRR
jgi:hypothetical protein